MMKKYLLVTLFLLLVITLVACTGVEDTSVMSGETPTLEEALGLLESYKLESYGTMQVTHNGHICTLAWVEQYNAIAIDVICH